MVGFVFEPSTTEEENNQVSKARNFKDPIQPFDQKLTNFADYFLDFDSIEEFFGDPERVSLDFEKRMEVEDKRFVVKDLTVDGSDLVFEEKKGIVDGSDLEGLMKVKGERVELERGGSLECSIEEEMGRVSLVAVSSLVVADGGGKVVGEEAEIDNGGLINGSGSDIGNGSGVNGKVVNDEDERESESSESSSNSSDDDGEEDSEEENQEEREVREVVNKELDDLGDMEEGEIRDVNGEEMVGRDDTDVEVFEEEDGDKMVGWSDFDEDEDAVNEGDPIRSKNELKVNCFCFDAILCELFFAYCRGFGIVKSCIANVIDSVSVIYEVKYRNARYSYTRFFFLVNKCEGVLSCSMIRSGNVLFLHFPEDEGQTA